MRGLSSLQALRLDPAIALDDPSNTVQEAKMCDIITVAIGKREMQLKSRAAESFGSGVIVILIAHWFRRTSVDDSSVLLDVESLANRCSWRS